MKIEKVYLSEFRARQYFLWELQIECKAEHVANKQKQYCWENLN
jgi:hypothetical protein